MSLPPPPPWAPPFNYYYACERAVDGDTIAGTLDEGHYKYWVVHIRLLGINTPELSSTDPAVREKAVAAKDFVTARVAGKTVVVHTEKPDKYAQRVLGVVYYLDATGAWRSLNQDLLDAGLAVVYLP